MPVKEPRISRSVRERKGHLSADAERLVAGALGLSNSGSRLEDAYWERHLAQRLERVLDSGHPQAVYDALDRLHQTDNEAYGTLIEAVEAASESGRVEHDGGSWDVLLMTAPVVAWTRFRIPSGPIEAADLDVLARHWQAHVLAEGVRIRVAPFLFSIDQLPREFHGVRRLTRRLGHAVVAGGTPRLDLRDLPEAADMLADARFLVAAAAVPAGQPFFRWQEIDAAAHASRVQCLEQWVSQGRPNLEPLLPGCGFECLLPDAYHINLRESDRRVRPYAIRAGVHFLTHALAVDADELRATIAAFGHERVDEYRIGLSVGDSEEVAQGVVWPLLGAESDEDEPSPLDRIRDTLRECGVTEIRALGELSEPEYCEDCGAPLYPNVRGEIAHAETPEEVEPESRHFH
ncbi:MAG: DUF2863 family protein [Burkholderiales bacterium]|nr:MAG: DUF2863 family protein [Burkholderiales bacterium]